MEHYKFESEIRERQIKLEYENILSRLAGSKFYGISVDTNDMRETVVATYYLAKSEKYYLPFVTKRIDDEE